MSEHIAARPECQPLVDALVAFMTKRSLRPMQFCEMLYGRDEKGHVKGPGQLYSVLRGKEIPSQNKMTHWKEKAGLDLAPIVARLEGMPRAVAVVKAKPPAVTTPVRAAVAAFESTQKAPAKKNPSPWPVMKPKPQERHTPPAGQMRPPLFAMTIDQDGFANLTLNLIDVKSEEAMRCFQTLSLANLINVKPS